MSSRDINDLDPRFKPFADKFLTACASQNFQVLIYCTYRSPDEQAALYAQGRTAPGHIVTNAPPLQSAHNFGLAFDGCPTIYGKPLWDEALNGSHWVMYGAIARLVGMEWGGDWATFREGPHCQLPNWKSLIHP